MASNLGFRSFDLIRPLKQPQRAKKTTRQRRRAEGRCGACGGNRKWKVIKKASPNEISRC